jgi:universal stress protein A
MFAPKKILVPTDFSDFSDNALALAVDVAKQHGSKISLLHVVSIVQQCVSDYCFDANVVETIERKSRESAQDMMQKQIARVAPPSGVSIDVAIQQGLPYQEILSEIEEGKADLVVIGSHGKTGLLGHLGSVADKVARNAKCPVMIVKEK